MVLWVGLQQSALVISARCVISWSYRPSADDFIVSEASEESWDMDGSGARSSAHVCVFRAEEGGTSMGAGRPPLIKLIQVGGGRLSASLREMQRASGTAAAPRLRGRSQDDDHERLPGEMVSGCSPPAERQAEGIQRSQI